MSQGALQCTTHTGRSLPLNPPPPTPTPTPQVAAWAKATPWVRWTAFWSMGRDRWDPAETYVSIHSSSIPQQPLEFTNIFKRYAS